jgi:hypothetical protein
MIGLLAVPFMLASMVAKGDLRCNAPVDPQELIPFLQINVTLTLDA